MAGLTDTLTRALLRAVRTALTSPAPTRSAPERPARTRSGRRPARGPVDYPGDFTGRPRISYAPLEDDRPDPGTGAWDPQRRPSEVRVNRIIRIGPAAVRRTGARLDRDRFEGVAAEVLRYF